MFLLIFNNMFGMTRQYLFSQDSLSTFQYHSLLYTVRVCCIKQLIGIKISLFFNLRSSHYQKSIMPKPQLFLVTFLSLICNNAECAYNLYNLTQA